MTNGSLRADARATRLVLLDAVGRLLAAHGLQFGLADVARWAGTSVATAYRHLGTKEAAIDEYLKALIEDWEAAIAEATADRRGWARLEAACAAWVERAWEWGPSAVFVRSPAGIIQRHQAGDPIVEANWRTLQPIVEELVGAGEIPAQSLEYAVLLWNTLFDERVIIDLRALGRDRASVAADLTRTLRNALVTPPSS